MNSTLYSLLLCSLAVLVLTQEMSDDSSSEMDKRARFAFAKRFAFNGPSRGFAFAKRSSASAALESDSDDSAPPTEQLMDKRARFAFAKRFAFNSGPSRNFAFAKRASFA